MRERDHQNLGRWSARPTADLEPIEVRTVDERFQPAVRRGPLPGRPLPGPGFHEPSRRSRGGFWVGLVLGLVPLALLAAGLLGYLLRNDSSTTSEDVDGAAIESSATPTTSAALAGASPTTETLEVQTSVAGPTVATGRIVGGAIEVDGTVPEGPGQTWLMEMSTLAAGLGVRLVDRTDVLDGATAGEMTISYPGAVVYQAGSPEEFEGQPHELFDGLARALQLGSARLTLAAFAEPSRPEDAHLALFRAEHVHEHLVALGVDPSRLAVEIRPLVDAAVGTGADQPVERRVDLEFRYGS